MAVEILIRSDGTLNTETNAAAGGKAPGATTDPGKQKDGQKDVSALLIQYGQQIIKQGVSIAVDYIGNGVIKDQISDAISIGGDIMTIIKGGWVGVAAVGIKTAATVINSIREQQRNDFKTQLLKEQAGNIIQLGGRYTND